MKSPPIWEGTSFLGGFLAERLILLPVEFVAAGFAAEASLGADVHKQCGPAVHEARTLFFPANEAVFPDGFDGGICIFFDVLHRAFPLIENLHNTMQVL